MIRSMTAFVRLTSGKNEGNWVVEIRSVNHRFFEFSLKSPPALFAVESRIRDLVQKNIPRGKVNVAICQNTPEEAPAGLDFDEKVIEGYLAGVKRLKKKYSFRDDISLKDILVLPMVLNPKKSKENPEESWTAVQKVLNKALKQAIKAKETEGSKLSQDIRNRLDKISEATEKVEQHAAGLGERYFKKLKEKTDLLLEDWEKDKDRIAREVAFLAERSDITEEMVRMKSHLKLFKSRLAGSGEVGRELDFLCQEMNREVNTMSAKAQLFEISQEVVFIKSELEKIREQIQNIE